MRSVFIVASILAIASAKRTFLRAVEPEPQNQTAIYLQPIKMMKGVSNFYQGYVEGLTKQKTMQGQCFDEKTMENAFKLIEELQTMDQSKIFQALPQILQIMTSFTECNMTNPIMDKMIRCYYSTTPDPTCEFSHITENISKNMFVVMGKFTDISTILGTFPASEEKEFLDQCRQIGLDFGTMLRVLLQ